MVGDSWACAPCDDYAALPPPVVVLEEDASAAGSTSFGTRLGPRAAAAGAPILELGLSRGWDWRMAPRVVLPGDRRVGGPLRCTALRLLE